MTANTNRYAETPLREIDGMEKLLRRIQGLPLENTDKAAEQWSYVLSDYVKWGNRKLGKMLGVFNFGTATNCPNRETDHCQVPWEFCYAGVAERHYPGPGPYRKRQSFLWEYMTYDLDGAELFANALLKVIERKRNDVYGIRLSEAGDFRADSDILKVNRIAEILGKEDIIVYTYSASDYLSWELAENFTVNSSNGNFEHADRRYMALPKDADLPDDAVWCPHDLQKQEGKPADEAIKCGECRLCIEPDGPDVFIPLQEH